MHSWIRLSPDNPSNPACVQQTRQLSKVAYPGDSLHLDCFTVSSKGTEKVSWFKNNELIESQSQRHLFTVDGGLVLVNVSKEDAGQYHCVDQLQITVRYQLTVKEGTVLVSKL